MIIIGEPVWTNALHRRANGLSEGYSRQRSFITLTITEHTIGCSGFLRRYCLCILSEFLVNVVSFAVVIYLYFAIVLFWLVLLAAMKVWDVKFFLCILITFNIFETTMHLPIPTETSSNDDVSVFQESKSSRKNADCRGGGGGRGMMMPMMPMMMPMGGGGGSPSISIVNNNAASTATTTAASARLRRRPAGNQSGRIVLMQG